MTKQGTTGPAARRPSPATTGPNWKLWGGAAAAVAVIGLVAAVVFAGGGTDTPTVSGGGDAAPDFALPNFEGETVRLSDFRGQGVVVNYWASWCLPCLAEMPGFEQVYQRHRSDVAFLGINLADDPSSAKAVVADTGISYPLAVDLEGTTFNAFGGYAMPTTVFISPEGEILELYAGDLTAEELEARLETHFGI